MGPNYDTACDESTINQENASDETVMKPIGLGQTRDLRYWWNNVYYIQMRTRMYIYIYIYNHMFMDEHQSIPQLVLNLYALDGTVVWLMSRWSKPEIISHVRSANVTWSRVNKIFSDVLRERNHELAIFRSHFHHFLCILSYAVGFFHDFPWFSRPFSTQKRWHRRQKGWGWLGTSLRPGGGISSPGAGAGSWSPTDYAWTRRNLAAGCDVRSFEKIWKITIFNGKIHYKWPFTHGNLDELWVNYNELTTSEPWKS